MAVREDYVTGTITLVSGSVDFTTVGSALESADIRKGDSILLPAKGLTLLVEEITGENAGKLSDPCPAAAAGAGQNLRIRFLADGQRYSATAQGLMEKLKSGNVEALAGLVGAFEKIAMFTAPGAMELIDRADLTAGVNFDERVDTLAGRAAYDANAKGFRVLVSNIGDGRAALYVKKSNTLADWSVASYFTGPVGPPPNVSVAPTDSLAPGDPATVSNVGTPTAPQFKFGIPAGRGFYNKGTYAAGTAYSKDDVVAYFGSSYIAKQATTGNLPTNTTYWDLIAAAGSGGDMYKTVYDPNGRQTDAFARANHTGSQATSTVTGLDTALGNRIRADAAQTLTAAQKAQALANIGTAWELISTVTPSGVAAVDFTNLAPYRRLRLSGSVQPSVNGALLYMRTSTNNGTSFDAGSVDYNYERILGVGTNLDANSTAQSAWILTNNTALNNAVAAYLTAEIFDFNQAAAAGLLWQIGWTGDNGTSRAWSAGYGFRFQLTARNALRVLASTGNISGALTLEGVRG